MGQRSAIIMLLVTSPVLLLPFVVLSLAASELGGAAVPVGVAVLWTGYACLVVAKWPKLRSGALWSVGPGGLTLWGRRLYWCSYVLMGSALLLMLFGLRFH